MVDSVLSGYFDTPAVNFTWPGIQKIDSLLNNEWIDLSAEIDNSTDLYTYMDLELVLASAAFVGVSVFEVFLVPLLHASVYPDWSSDDVNEHKENEAYKVGQFTLSGTTAAQRVQLLKISITPKFKIGLRNKSGADTAATGNSLNYRRWGHASR